MCSWILGRQPSEMQTSPKTNNTTLHCIARTARPCNVTTVTVQWTVTVVSAALTVQGLHIVVQGDRGTRLVKPKQTLSVSRSLVPLLFALSRIPRVDSAASAVVIATRSKGSTPNATISFPSSSVGIREETDRFFFQNNVKPWVFNHELILDSYFFICLLHVKV